MQLFRFLVVWMYFKMIVIMNFILELVFDIKKRNIYVGYLQIVDIENYMIFLVYLS